MLMQVRFVERCKEGRWIYYPLPTNELPMMAQHAMDWMSEYLADDPRIERDQQRLEEICALDPQQLYGSRNGRQARRRRARAGRSLSG